MRCYVQVSSKGFDRASSLISTTVCSAAITSDGCLYTWGRGNYGRLGHGKSNDCFVPTVVAGLKGVHVTKVSCGSGDSHTLCVTIDGKVYSWGDGDYGKLGK